jgi:hypothetical protein
MNCEHCGVPCAEHDEKRHCGPCAKGCDKKVYMNSSLQIGGYSTVTIGGKTWHGLCQWPPEINSTMDEKAKQLADEAESRAKPSREADRVGKRLG